MSSNELKAVLLWCVGIDYALLLVWFGIFLYAHDWAYRLLARWFKLSVETFDAINFAGIALYKIGVILLMVVPLIALCLTS